MATTGARFCTECGKPTPEEDLFAFQDRRVCLECKPAFAQRLRQDGTLQPAPLMGVEYGGFWIRFLARIIDGLIVGVALLAANSVLILLLGGQRIDASRGFRTTGLLLTAVLGVVNIGLNLIYEAYFLVRNGATPGKIVLHLRVVTSYGGPISWGRAIGRFFCYYLDNLTLLIGYIIAAFDSEKRALHDHICGTRVVRQTSVQTMLATHR